MKTFYYLSFAFLLIYSCTSTKEVKNVDTLSVQYANSITLEELKENLYEFASDAYEGRDTGEPGQKRAAEFLKQNYVASGVSSPISKEDYFQEVPEYFLPEGVKESENVVAFIKGSEKPNEFIVISAHYDHIGVSGKEIFNGADDDASGTVAVLEIAEAFQLASNAGHGPKRSILFINLTAEEKGLYGSKWYVKNPIFPLNHHVTNLNIDMIGRVDDKHKNNPNYIYLIGSNKLSRELHRVSEEVNTKLSQLTLDYTFNDENYPNRFYYRSDHYNFAKNNIPIIFYFNGVHEDYHKTTDTADKINYEVLTKRTKLVFHTAWELANRENKVAIDI